jgi:hypothetical protein
MFGRVMMLTVVAAVFAGDAWSGKIPTGRLDSIHILGVFSQFGDQAEIKKVGVTVFGNKLTYLPIADWNINELVITEVDHALAGRYIIQVAPLGMSIYKADKKPDLRGFFKPRESPFLALPGLDAYLVFQPATEAFPYPSNQSVSGLGMLHDHRANSDIPGTEPTSAFGFDLRTHKSGVVYAIYDIYLVDAKSGDIIALQEAMIPTQYKQTLGQVFLYGQPYEPVRYPHPHQFVHDDIWSDTADALTDTQKKMFRDILTDLIKQSVSYSLGAMGLTDTRRDPAGADQSKPTAPVALN